MPCTPQRSSLFLFSLRARADQVVSRVGVIFRIPPLSIEYLPVPEPGAGALMGATLMMKRRVR